MLKRKIRKFVIRLDASFLALAMLCAMLPLSAFAASANAGDSGDRSGNVPQVTSLVNKQQFSGTNSFGELLVDQINTYNNGSFSNDDAQSTYVVTDTQIQNKTAHVKYSVLSDCRLTVGIYTEDGIEMLGSGSSLIQASGKTADVSIDIDEMPEYFLVKAFLTDSVTDIPLGKAFVCELYTKEIQDLKSLTLDDFEDREFINFDDSAYTNFAVFRAGVFSIRSGGVNVYDETSSSTAAKKYVFKNADQTLRSLQRGDVFSCLHGDDVLIVKVADIQQVKENNSYTVTILGSNDLGMDDVFDYVKIESGGKIKDYELDDSVLDEYTTAVDYRESPVYHLLADSESNSNTDGHSVKLHGLPETYEYVMDCVHYSAEIGGNKEDDHEDDHEDDVEIGGVEVEPHCSVEVDVGMKLKTTIDYYFSLRRQYFSMENEYKLAFSLGITGEVSFKIPFCKVSVVIQPGLNLDVVARFVVTMEGSVQVEYSFTQSSLFIYSSLSGARSEEPPPSFDTELSIEGSLFVGLEIELTPVVIEEHVAKVPVTLSFGVKFSGEPETVTLPGMDYLIHDCALCIKGETSFSAEIEFEVDAWNCKIVGAQWDIAKDIHLYDWYHSVVPHNKKGIGTCPYKKFLVETQVCDEEGNPVTNALITVNSDPAIQASTDENGNCSFYLHLGKYTYVASKGDQEITDSFRVEAKKCSLDIVMEIAPDDPEVPDEPVIPDEPVDPSFPEENGEIVATGNCGDSGSVDAPPADNLKWTLYESGLLEITGSGYMQDNLWNDAGWNDTFRFNGQEVKIKYLKVMGAEGISYRAFANLPLLNVYLSSSVKTIGEEAFKGCSKLVSINIPASVKDINELAFFDCKKLGSVTIPESVVSGSLEEAFSGCDSLTEINVDPENPKYRSFDGVLYNKERTALLLCPAKKTGTLTIPATVSELSGWAIPENSALTDISVDSGNQTFVSSNGFLYSNNYRTLFRCLPSKTGSVNIIHSVTAIGDEAFYGCSGLTEVTIPGSVTSIGSGAFLNCSGLTSISVPGSVTSIGKSAFSGCSGLTEVTVSSGVRSIGDCAFSGCTSLASFTLPDGITEIGNGTFYRCRSLTYIDIPDTVTSIGTDGNNEYTGAFEGCTGLTQISIPDSVSTIGGRAFSYCTGLTGISLPKNLSKIGVSAFSYCTGLTGLIMPKSVTSIEYGAFYCCSKLADVYYTGSQSDWNNISIEYENTDLKEATIHYGYTYSSSGSSSGASSGASSAPVGAAFMAGSGDFDRIQTQTFEDLLPNVEYLMAVVKDEEADVLLAPDNLLYIDQKTAGNSGKLTFTYVTRGEYQNAEIVLLSSCEARIDIGYATAQAERLVYNGEPQCPAISVTYFGEPLYNGVDYYVSGCKRAVNPGSYDFTVIGMGAYRGTLQGSFEIVSADVRLNLNTISMLEGTSFTPKAFLYPSSSAETVTWSTSDESVAKVDVNGNITAIGKGKAIVTAKAAGGSSAGIKVTVVASTKPTTSITLKQKTQNLLIKRSKMNPSASLSASIKGGSKGKTWYSDDINVVTVNKSGKVTAIAPGTANVYCRTEDGTTSEPCQVSVGCYRIDSDNLINGIVYVLEGESGQLSLCQKHYSGESITWKSGSKNVTVDSDGGFQGVKKGTATITVTDSNKNKDTVKVVVVKPCEYIWMKSYNPAVYAGKTKQLKTGFFTKGSNDPVFWSSSNEHVATVNRKGVVRGLEQGTAVITARTFSGATISTSVTVRSRAKAIEFTETVSALHMQGDTGRLAVNITAPANCNDTVTWSTSNKKVIEITNTSNDGRSIMVKSGAKGTATITAKTGSGKKITWKVTSVNRPAESLKLNKQNVQLYAGASLTVSGKVAPKGCNDVIFWRSADPNIATVSAQGKIKGISQGTTEIYAETFGGQRATVVVNVLTKAKTISVNQTSIKMDVSETVAIHATLSPEGCNDTVKWSSSNTKIATVTPSDDGRSAVVTGIKKGTVTVTVRTGSGKSRSVRLTVG